MLYFTTKLLLKTIQLNLNNSFKLFKKKTVLRYLKLYKTSQSTSIFARKEQKITFSSLTLTSLQPYEDINNIQDSEVSIHITITLLYIRQYLL